MNNVLPVRETPATLRHVRINAFDGERYGMVSVEGQRYWLTPALGCLLQPAVGDSVLVSLAGTEGYILCVLERSQTLAGELRIPGDLHLSLPSGALSIETRDGLALNAGPTLAVQAHQMSAALGQTELALGSLAVCGERADSQWLTRNDSTVRHHEQSAQHRADYGDSHRQVHGHEELSAGSVRQRVAKDFSLRGETLDLFADASVALRGERINLG